MSFHLIDDHLATFSDHELVQMNVIVQEWVGMRDRRDGGAPMIEWIPRLRRAASITTRARSQVTRDHVTSPPDEPESISDSCKELPVIEAAAVIGISPSHLHRLIRARDPGLTLAITHQDPLRLDADAIKKYAADRPSRRRAA
jgi:hypothetical protein